MWQNSGWLTKVLPLVDEPVGGGNPQEYLQALGK
jgi:hypothetical protein